MKAKLMDRAVAVYTANQWSEGNPAIAEFGSSRRLPPLSERKALTDEIMQIDWRLPQGSRQRKDVDILYGIAVTGDEGEVISAKDYYEITELLKDRRVL